MTSTYARFFHLLPEPETVYNVIELGVHELEDTIPLLLHYLNANIIGWECNPGAVAALHRKVISRFDRFQLIPFAADEENEMVAFYPHADVSGASSFWQNADGKNPNPILVYSARIDTMLLNTLPQLTGCAPCVPVDLVFADIQGAELRALRGMGHLLKKVRGIVLERPKEGCGLYFGAPVCEQYERFMQANGFTCVHVESENDHEENAVYLKK